MKYEYEWQRIVKYKTVQVVKSYSKFKDDIITNLHILKEHNGKYYVIEGGWSIDKKHFFYNAPYETKEKNLYDIQMKYIRIGETDSGRE